MKKPAPAAVTRLVLLVTLALSASLQAADFRAGVASRIVTPDPLLPVSGGVGASTLAVRKQGELTVRALVFEADSSRVALVSADFLGFPAALGDRVRSKVRGIPPENVLIGVTHTHSAPDCYGFPDEKGKTSADLKYLDLVCSRMAEAINEALDRLQPAALKIATGEARGQIAYNAYADKLYDPRCHVVQVLAPQGTVIATLVNYAIHPEVLGSDQGICSPDLVGPLYDRIAEKGGGIGLFLNSAQGGMVTADNRTGDGKESRSWAECVRIGTLLADEALRIVALAPVQKSPGIQCHFRTVAFPIDSPVLQTVLKTSPIGVKTREDGRIEARLNLINLGNAQLLTIPGEALPNIGYYLKRKMRGEHNLILGLTNDAFGYILTKVDWNSFRRYDYITRVCLGEMTGEILIDEALRLIADSPAPASLH